MIETGVRSEVPPTVGHLTKEKILDAAERLFSEHGFAATSLRTITSEAGVNLAAVNYHFHSKDELIQAVFERRLGAINRERLRLLDECEVAAGEAPPALEPVVRAFVAPLIRSSRDMTGGGNFRRVMGRMYVEPGDAVRCIVVQQMQEVARRFVAAYRRIFPDLSLVELLWRLHFCIGVMAHTLAGTFALQALSGGVCDPSDVEGTLERIVSFLAAGLRAPVSRASSQG